MKRLLASFLTLLLAAMLLPGAAEAQLGDRIKDRIKRDAERRVENRAVQIAHRTLDLAEDAIVCAVTDEDCIEDARKKGQEPVVVDKEGEPVSGYPQTEDDGAPGGANGDPSGGNMAGGEPGGTTVGSSGGDEVWANYEFIPGDRVLYTHDFEGTRVGNFPSRLGYIAGNLDVVRLGSGEDANRALRVGEGTSEGGGGGNGCFTIPLPETLPEQFTLEFRVMTTDPLGRAGIDLFSDGSDDTPDTRCNYPPPVHVYVNNKEQGLQWKGAKSGDKAGFVPNEWATVALGCDGPYCKLYVNGERVANVPRFEFPRADKLHLFMNVYRYMLFVDDLRIAEGGARSLYDDLMSEGFISTTAIRFDTGSAQLRPESGGILGEILMMLEDHPDLRLLVEGHTDSQGADDANQALSEQRAEAVAGWLVGQGLDAGRLDTVGHGESQPAADNGTPEGMAQNRRVVFRQQ